MRWRAVADRVLVFGPIGLLVSVLLAWASSLWLPNPMMAKVPTSLARASWVPEGHELEDVYRGRRLGATKWQIQGMDWDPKRPGIDSFVTGVGAWGLPLRALGSFGMYDARADAVLQPEWKLGIRVPMWLIEWAIRLNPIGGTGYTARAPLLPLWGGLVVDSAFWGLAAFGVARLFRWRRGVRRARRGRCRGCGYPLGGLETCPECGGRA